jgi:hypothetical protein
MSRKLELLLREYGDFVIKNLEWHNEFGENILYRAGIMGGRIQIQGDGHKILCPDMPRRLQKVDIALKRIPTIPSWTVRVFYCAPMNLETGENYTKGQLASLTRMSLTAFDTNLKKGKKLLKTQLWG